MNRKIYPVHQSILQMYCQRIEHIRSEKRDVTKTEALSLQHHCFTSDCFAWLLSKNFSAALAYQIPMLIVIWTIFAEYSLRFVKTIAKLNFQKYRVLEPRTAQNPRPRRAKDNTVEAKAKDFTNLSSRSRTSSRTSSLQSTTEHVLQLWLKLQRWILLPLCAMAGAIFGTNRL